MVQQQGEAGPYQTGPGLPRVSTRGAPPPTFEQESIFTPNNGHQDFGHPGLSLASSAFVRGRCYTPSQGGNGAQTPSVRGPKSQSHHAAPMGEAGAGS